MEIEALVETGNPAFTLRDESASPKPKASRPPTANPASTGPKIRPDASEEQPDLVEDLLSPPSIKGFAWSLAGHAIFLLILAFWYFAPAIKSVREFDTRLAGSELGDPSGDQLKGGLGMDTPLAMPASPNGPELKEVEHTFTSIPVSELDAPPNKNRENTGASNGGGVNLTNPGQAGNGDGFGVAKFGHGGERINGVDVKVGDPQFTLIWDSRADIDLHVIEPDGSEISWENRNGTDGGELDVDDVDGFGPENVNYAEGKGPRGKYRWFVHYYGGLGGMVQHTRWKVRVKYAGKTEVYQGKLSRIGEKSEPKTLILASDRSKKEESPQAAKKPESTAKKPETAPTPAAPVTGGPVVFSPAGAGFSVRLPSEPKTGRKELETSIGSVVAQTFTSEQSDGGLTLTTMDFPASAVAKTDPGKLLDEIGAKALVETKGKATSNTKITLDKAMGRETELTVPEAIVAGGGVGRIRVYLSGGRVFVLSSVGAKTFLDSPESKEFFSTFSISETK